MKLLYRISLRISIALLILFAGWGVLFYYIIIDEINDETDDSLEHYSEYIIIQALTGELLPDKDNGTNNSYFLTEVSPEYAKNTSSVRFLDQVVYVQSKGETEPARICKTVFKNNEGRFYELTVMVPTIEKEDLKQTILFWMILLYVLLLLSIIIINAYVMRRSLRPLYVILDWIDHLSLKNETLPLHIDSDISEFRKLSDALIKSAQRNAEVYEQQSAFIGHASHELQTPIAVAQNRLEILADDPALTETQLTQILKAKKSLETISKLNKTLLLLTKIENMQFPDSKAIDVNRLLLSLVEDFREAYTYLDIRCTVEENARLSIEMNETLASVLFSNLIKNAYLHNDREGRVHVLISSQSVRISNTARHGALNPDYIFRRFYQDSTKEGSAGLGLSLVESVCKLYSATISYAYEEEMHLHHFEVNLSAIVSKH